MYHLIIEINDCNGDLTDISSIKASLIGQLLHISRFYLDTGYLATSLSGIQFLTTQRTMSPKFSYRYCFQAVTEIEYESQQKLS